MKKTVLLFALSFVLVAFLNAQNDCTGNSQSEAPKKAAIKGKPVNYPNGPKDCSKPGKTAELESLYMSEAFIELMVNKPGTKPVEHWGHVVPNSELKSGDVTFNPSPGEVFSASGPRACCAPPGEWKRYESLKR